MLSSHEYCYQNLVDSHNVSGKSNAFLHGDSRNSLANEPTGEMLDILRGTECHPCYVEQVLMT
jgi:hypothetical protein